MFWYDGSRFLPFSNLKITSRSQHPRQFLQRLFILLIKPIQLRTINIDDSNSFPILHNRHDNLTLTGSVAGNMAWELFNVVNQLCGLGRGGGAAHAAVKCNDLTCYLWGVSGMGFGAGMEEVVE